MKKIILLITICLILAACGASNEEKIIGTWKEVGTGSTIDEFRADGTFKYTYEDGSVVNGEYKIDGDKLYTTEEGLENLPSEIVKLDDENLVLGFSGLGMTFETTYKRLK